MAAYNSRELVNRLNAALFIVSSHCVVSCQPPVEGNVDV